LKESHGHPAREDTHKMRALQRSQRKKRRAVAPIARQKKHPRAQVAGWRNVGRVSDLKLL